MTARVLRLVSLACLVPAAVVAAALPAQAAGATPLVGAPAHHQRADVVRASGAFDVLLDFRSLRLQPLGNRWVLTVSGTLTFSGALQGTATATTTAFEDA